MSLYVEAGEGLQRDQRAIEGAAELMRGTRHEELAELAVQAVFLARQVVSLTESYGMGGAA